MQIWICFRMEGALTLREIPDDKSKDRIAAILNAKPVANAALGPDFFSSIQFPARAVSGALHETVADLITHSISPLNKH
ncbi:MAG: hypothetical protein WAK26_04625, partial [Terracidiphilus sp.]